MPRKRATKKKKTAKRQPFCYTADLVKALGVSRRTVYHYVQRGLLPSPILLSDGRTGVRSRWPMVALDHAEFILEQQELGYTLAEIAKMIAARWGTADKVKPKDETPAGPADPSGNNVSGAPHPVDGNVV